MERRWGLQDETQYHNRINVGQIVGVRTDDGIITVRLTTGALHKMPIPVYGFSMPINNQDNQELRTGASASWIRYMPQVGDFVKVGFGPDNRPEVIAYATWGDLPSERGPPGQLGGYAQFSRARDRGVAGLETFFTLNPGEWDLRSSGNAYIRGGQFGTLFLAGGGVTLSMQKEQEEMNARAGLTKVDSTGAEIRFGDVKRQTGTDFEEVVVPGSGKEWLLQLSQQTAPEPVIPNQFYTAQAGDIRDSQGVIEVSSTGNPLRLREQVFDGLPQAGQPVPYVRTVDAIGNIEEVLGATATSHVITGSSIASFSRTGYLDLTYGASSSISLQAPLVNLGSNATEPVVRGNLLNTYLTTILSVPTALGPSGPATIGLVAGELSTVTFTE